MSDDAVGGPRSADGDAAEPAPDGGWDFTRPVPQINPAPEQADDNSAPADPPATSAVQDDFGPVTLTSATAPNSEDTDIAQPGEVAEPADDAHPELAAGAAASVAEPTEKAAKPAKLKAAKADNVHRPMWRGRSVGDRVRVVTSGVGQTLITTGLVILLFVAYEVWVTNIFANQKQNKVHEQLAKDWSSGRDPLEGTDKAQLPPGQQVLLPTGTGFANLYIPAFGKDYAKTIVEGTDDDTLEKGPGHYAKTAIPGQVGNFAVAGHRVGKGEPFLNLDQLKGKDSIIVQTASNWYVYQVVSDGSANAETRDSQGVIGMSIVSPTDIGVIAAVPGKPSATPSKAYLTLTTCHPKYTANQRLIIHAELVRTVPNTGSDTPKEMGGAL